MNGIAEEHVPCGSIGSTHGFEGSMAVGYSKCFFFGHCTNDLGKLSEAGTGTRLGFDHGILRA